MPLLERVTEVVGDSDMEVDRVLVTDAVKLREALELNVAMDRVPLPLKDPLPDTEADALPELEMLLLALANAEALGEPESAKFREGDALNEGTRAVTEADVVVLRLAEPLSVLPPVGLARVVMLRL